MAIFGFKKRKDEKLERGATAAKTVSIKTARKSRTHQEFVKPAVVKADLVGKGKTGKVSIPLVNFAGASGAIIRPRVTEKSGLLSQDGRYTFEVVKGANKQSIAKAINALYKVKPIKVAVLNTPTKNVFVKNRKGTVAGIRKAIITLRKGEKIDFV